MKTDRHKRIWSKEELEYLEDSWGEVTPDTIARNLGRTLNAVIVKSKILQLGSYLASSEYLNAFSISKIMGIDSHVIQRTWKRYGFKMTKRKIRGNKRFEIIKVDELLEWLRTHQELWDSRRIEPYALGIEPEWLKEKREKDKQKPKARGTQYTAEEDNRIVMMTRLGKTQAEIAKELDRSQASVNARVQRLDIWGTGRAKNAN